MTIAISTRSGVSQPRRSGTTACSPGGPPMSWLAPATTGSSRAGLTRTGDAGDRAMPVILAP